MAVRIFIASLLSAAVMMVWGFVFWGLSGMPSEFMRPLPGGETVAAVLTENVLETGVYFHPFQPDDMANAVAMEDFRDQHRRGPIFFLAYVRQGSEPMPPSMYLFGYLQMFAVSLVAAILLALAAPRLSNFLARWLFVALVGVLVAVVNLSDAIWFHHPWSFRMMLAGSAAISWLLAGLPLAAIVRAAASDAEPL